jgi:hypothetical protein
LILLSLNFQIISFGFQREEYQKSDCSILQIILNRGDFFDYQILLCFGGNFQGINVSTITSNFPIIAMHF